MNKKIIFAIACILFNGYGVPSFMQGHTNTGLIRLVLTCTTAGLFGVVNTVMGIILAVKVFGMSDEDFNENWGKLDFGIVALDQVVEK